MFEKGKWIPVKILDNKTGMIIGVGDICDRYQTAMMKIYHLETKCRKKDISNEERGKLVLEIRHINDLERIPLRNTLNNIFGKELWERRIT